MLAIVRVCLWSVALCTSALAETPLSDQTSEVIKIVKQCVAAVHAAGDCWTQKSGAVTCSYSEHEFYKNFDAFYNSANGLVENNVTLQGERKALFLFKKCMAEKGVPLN
jgi:hypothetical protein